MSLRRADVRFLLPRPVGRALVLGGLEAWSDGLREAGIEVETGDPAVRADLVVAPAALAARAAAFDPDLLVVEGAASVPDRRAKVVVPLPSPDEPELLVPVGEPAAVRYALRHWRRGRTGPERLRNALAGELLAHGRVVPGRQPTALAARRAGPPFIVAPALDELGLQDVTGFAAFGRWASPVNRGAYLLFPSGARDPHWVVKFARIPGLAAPFERDERGLKLAEATGGVVARHATRLLARFDVDGYHASLETAATGERLATLLESRRERRRGLEAVEKVAAWTVAVAEATRAPAQTLDGERAQLATDVLRPWGLPSTISDDLAAVEAVFQHGDLNEENVLVDNDGFRLIDWEAAQAHGLPLWDLFFFLTHALATVDGVASEAEREQHASRLWRGELPTSEVLFRWTRSAVQAGGIPVDAVGSIATLLWLRLALLDTDGDPDGDAPTASIARSWLSDPALGPGWNRWRN